MSATPDIGRLIQLIMENPSLVEEISKLASSDEQKPAKETPIELPLPEPTELKTPVSEPAVAIPTQTRARRAQLLGALKPYVSAERAKAIDSMMSIAEILDMMKAR